MDLLAELARYGPGAPQTAASAAEARAYCRRLAENHYENFSVVSHLFPRHLHQPLCNVYAYCRWADDLADETANPQQSLALLDWWQQQLERLYAGAEPTHPVFVALGETIRKFDLPRQPLTDLLVAFRRDQTQTRYETLADLLTYCEKSANPVGRIVLALGRSANDENVRLSDAICTGLQLANFCQDVKRDCEGGRIYLPQELCRRHGWHVSRFTAGRCDNDFRELLRSFVFEAETRLMEGEGLARRVGPDLKMAVRVFSAGGFAILAAIRRCRYDVWSRRPTVGRLTKLRLIASAWWTA
jgi:squalene synthase HpnC